MSEARARVLGLLTSHRVSEVFQLPTQASSLILFLVSVDGRRWCVLFQIVHFLCLEYVKERLQKYKLKSHIMLCPVKPLQGNRFSMNLLALQID